MGYLSVRAALAAKNPSPGQPPRAARVADNGINEADAASGIYPYPCAGLASIFTCGLATLSLSCNYQHWGKKRLSAVPAFPPHVVCHVRRRGGPAPGAAGTHVLDSPRPFGGARRDGRARLRGRIRRWQASDASRAFRGSPLRLRCVLFARPWVLLCICGGPSESPSCPASHFSQPVLSFFDTS